MVAEPVFRANKRRKVYRKRADSDNGDEGPSHIADHGESQSEQLRGNREDEAGTALSIARRGGIRKQGIAFSSTESRRTEQQDNEEKALIPFSAEEVEEEDVHNDRFVKPTGRVTTTEDKHMYVGTIDACFWVKAQH